MSLYEHREEGILRVRWVAADAIGVDEETLRSSFLLTPGRLQRDWPPRSVAEIDDAAIDAVLALRPEVVLLGTGARQVFPDARVLAGFLRRRVGIEVMDNAAAARTFQLLAQEGRQVVACFLLAGPPKPVADPG